MSDIMLTRINISFNFSSTEELSDTPSITSITASAFVDNGEQEIYAGYVLMHRITADEKGSYDLLDQMDHDGEIFSFVDLFDSTYQNFKKEVIETLNDEDASPDFFLIMDRAEVKKEFRGNSIALKLMEALLKEYDDILYRTVFLIAQPLQFNKHSKDKKLSSEFENLDEDVSRNKLFSYYEKIGFKRIKDTRFMALNTELPRNKIFF